jgi:hypothetical protein
MKAVKLVLMLAVAGLAFQYWQANKPATGSSPNGFVALPTLAGSSPGQVIVFAPENCPSEKAQHADELARQLTARNIPTIHSHEASFTSFDPDPSIGIRLDSVMKGELPIVFVNGKGKANPTLEEILAEYRGAR